MEAKEIESYDIVFCEKFGQIPASLCINCQLKKENKCKKEKVA